MDVLKLATAGSVDDGKSTLIGRLLYDTKSLTTDKIEAIKQSSKRKGYDYLDFSLATDGLVAEREQGITIDVAHIYFSTENRSYIIADTPGHVEYTRNMVTGASNAETSIVLIDARNGVVEQTKRHFFINKLLQVKYIIVAVNKMDLVDYNKDVFEAIQTEFLKLIDNDDNKNLSIEFVPVSALHGDNIKKKSTKMNWYTGNSILELLEEVETNNKTGHYEFRFSVQSVIRPKQNAFHDFRGYTGRVKGDSIKVGDKVTILPSLKETKVKEIRLYDKVYNEAHSGASVTVSLEDDINISRGDTIVKSNQLPSENKSIEALVCWMDSKKLVPGSKYIIQHNTNEVLSKVNQIEYAIETDFSGTKPVSDLRLNDIGKVSFKLNKALFYDPFIDNKSNGAFIIIDQKTNTTAGVGFLN